MESHKASLRFRKIIFILTALMIAFAFVHSSIPADLSDGESLGVLNFLRKALTSIGITAELTNHIVRKLAHFTEYAAIGALLASCAYSFNRANPLKYCVQILFAGLLTAVIDETIQLNVEGRSGQITDVLLDFSGVVAGAAVMLAIYAVYMLIRKKNKGR